MLTLAFVHTYLAVVDHGGIREAARKLACAQATVSQHVRKLESELGVVLLHRSHGACQPTNHGHRFLPFARSLIAAAERVDELFDPQCLRIGASSNIGVYFLPGLLADFQQQLSTPPKIDVALGSNPEIHRRLLAGEIDLALSEWWPAQNAYRSDIWHLEPLVAIVAPDHPLAIAERLPVAALADWPLLGGESASGTGQLLQRALGDGAPALRINLSLGSTEAVKQAVMAGLGLSVVLAGTVRREVRAGHLVALPLDPPDLAKAFLTTYPRELPSDSLAARFATFLKRSGAAKLALPASANSRQNHAIPA